MVYYAKSAEKCLSREERKKLNHLLQKLLEQSRGSLTQKETALLQTAYRQTDDLKKEIQLTGSDEKGTYEKQKLLQEHLQEIVLCAKKFFQQYGNYFSKKEKRLILFACAIHDLGKVNGDFQEMVTTGKSAGRQIPHGWLSSLVIGKRWFLKHFEGSTIEDFKALTTAVFFHHTRDMEWNADKVEEFCNRCFLQNLGDFLKKDPPKLYFSNYNSMLFEASRTAQHKSPEEEIWNKYLVIKGMLNKFDWAVSAGFQTAEEEAGESGRIFQEKLMSAVKGSMRPAQIFMQGHRNQNLIVVAPTGSGKTEAALLWLNGGKGFYTLPLRVSSNAIYDRIHNKYEFEKAALVHSDSLQHYLLEEDKNGYAAYEKAKMLSAPMTVCTVDQLFKFVYKAQGTESFAATLKYSRLVIDEIQSYEPRVLAALIYGLRTVYLLGGKFAIITATFPPVLRHFMEQYGLAEKKAFLYRNFALEDQKSRHRFLMHDGDFDLNEILGQSDRKKILVICNTVKKAQKVYEELYEHGARTLYLLHSKYIRGDRKRLEHSILHFSQNPEETGIWISTQIVEASLDIDFDVLYTEMCTCDSLLQRMGRCNRAMRYLPEEVNVHIYVNSNGVGIRSVYDPDIYGLSVKYLEQYENKLFTEQMKNEYIENVYYPDQLKGTRYYQELERTLHYFDSINPLDYEKEEAEAEFRKITTITVMPEQIYLENAEAIETYLSYMKQPHVGKEIKAILQGKIDELTLSLTIYGKKLPEGVDRECILGTQIHRCRLQYEFNTAGGRGLLMEPLQEKILFF